MRDFFSSWKRKAGCVTLGMVCVLSCEWVRSTSIVDRIWFPSGTVGAGSGFVWWIGMSPETGWELDSIPLRELEGSPEGWAFNEYEWEGPFWLVVLPLTLLSAWLLLRKPRPAKPMETTEPASAEAP